MKILYISLSYVPSHRASSLQVMNMCSAFVQEGHTVTLVTKENSEEKYEDDAFEFYGIPKRFEIVNLPRPGYRGGGLIYSMATLQFLIKKKREIDLVYCRDFVGCWLALSLGCCGIFELHDVPHSMLSTFIFKQIVQSELLIRLVLNSQGLKVQLGKHSLLPSKGVEVIVARNGTTPWSNSASSTYEVPNNFSNQDINIGYVGNLYTGRGIEIIVKLASLIPKSTFHVIGGSGRDIAYWNSRQVPSNLRLYGFVKPSQLRGYYENMDILLMPYQRSVMMASGKSDSSSWMSPLKMFEYMATGKPIVSSDLPVLQEVLEHERNALLVPPEDVEAWGAAISRLIDDPALRQSLGQTAQQDLLENYTWDARARKVLSDL